MAGVLVSMGSTLSPPWWTTSHQRRWRGRGIVSLGISAFGARNAAQTWRSVRRVRIQGSCVPCVPVQMHLQYDPLACCSAVPVLLYRESVTAPLRECDAMPTMHNANHAYCSA